MALSKQAGASRAGRFCWILVVSRDRIEFRHENHRGPDRVSNYRDTAMRNISRMSVRQDGIDKTFVVTSDSSRRPRNILSSLPPFIHTYMYFSFSLDSLPAACSLVRLIDATRFLRVITAARSSRTGLICQSRSNLSVEVIVCVCVCVKAFNSEFVSGAVSSPRIREYAE